jgi:PBP1b-binding outer membrane lipoprotein LpoB
VQEFIPNAMKKILLTFLSLIILSGCSLLSAYTVTFTTPVNSAVNPVSDTLDLALSQPAMAYISEVDCANHDPVALLPIVSFEMKTSNVHNLSLELLSGYEARTECEVRVTVFDQTTTATSSDSISLYVLEKPVETEEYAEQIISCESQEGTWNACGSACEEGDELCIQVCVPQCEFTKEPIADPIVEVPRTETTQATCVDAGGEWNRACSDDEVCEEWCDIQTIIDPSDEL